MTGIAMGYVFRQTSLLDDCPIAAAVEELAINANEDLRGAVFTRKEVVDFILDLVGFTANRPLHTLRVLEPSFGGGQFLFPIIDRLLMAWRAAGDDLVPAAALSDCIRAVELHRRSFECTHAAVVDRLKSAGIAPAAALAITNKWLIQGDFLLIDMPHEFDFVVGNPPYVRQELIPYVLLKEYRSRYETIYDRADLYIPFIERSLSCLVGRGVMGFICADRWTKNRYGGPLRAKVANGFRLKVYVDLTGVKAFNSEVTAYPAITVISREPSGVTRIAFRPDLEPATLSQLAMALLADVDSPPDPAVTEVSDVAVGSEPWMFEPSRDLALVRRLESSFPLLEQAGCRVGIGVATGADDAFIGPYAGLDVEEERKERLVMTRDIANGVVQWRGYGVINPFDEAGGLVDLSRYPRLMAYLEARRAAISARHCARKTPSNWYRTIDRITPALTRRPKLLIPDIKGTAHIVYEDGQLYPHHNLYFITSDEWDLRALQAVLMSGIARLFVATYSTRMRGGFLRFQAQYLRRIRLPRWAGISEEMRRKLQLAALSQDIETCNQCVAHIYRLSVEETSTLGVVSV
jgi:TaqI-like C-terminal specificity domain/Eco57I restriction-modification methylase